MNAEPAELVAWGVALGAGAAFVHVWFGRLRARLVFLGRTYVAWATHPAALLSVGAALVLAYAEGPLAAWSFLVGLLGARTLVLGEWREPAGG